MRRVFWKKEENGEKMKKCQGGKIKHENASGDKEMN